MDKNKIKITKQHMKLLHHLNICYNDRVEFGAPAVDPKGPYGNRDVCKDMGRILGIKPSKKENDYPIFDEEQEEKLISLHKEMTYVLQILCRHHKVKTGNYSRVPYTAEWKKLN